MLNDKEFEDLFRKRFDDFGDEPPEKGWEKIQADLKGKRRPGFARLWATLLGLLLLSIPVGLYLTSNDTLQQKESPMLAEDLASASQPKESKTPAKPQASGKTNQANSKAIDRQVGSSQESISTDTLSIPGRSTDTSPVVAKIDSSIPRAVKSGAEQLPMSGKKAEVLSSGMAKSKVGQRPAVIPSRSEKNQDAGDLEGLSPTREDLVDTAKKKSKKQSGENKYKWRETLTEDDVATFKKNRIVISNHTTKGRIETGAAPTTNPSSEKDFKNNSDSIKSTEVQTPESGRSQNLSDAKGAPGWDTNSPGNSWGKYRKPVDILPIHSVSAWNAQRPSDSLSFIQMQPIAIQNEKAETVVQDTTKTISKSSKYAWGVYYSPRYSFSRFVVNREDPVFVDQIQTKGRPLSDRLGYEVGLTLSRKLSEKWRLNGSLVYVHISEVARFRTRSLYPDSLRVSLSPSDTINVSPVYNTQAQRYESTYDYAGLNLGVSYSWLTGNKGELYVSAGMGMRLLVRGTTHRYQNDKFIETVYFPAPDNPMEQLNTQFSLGIGYARRLNKTMKITIEPTINYFLGSTFKEREPVGIKPYTLGVNIGLQLGR
jgi:hypothetical protein